MPISYGTWQVYPWKNELATQSERVAVHYSELLDDDFEGEHSPLDMLDRAIVLSGFAIRRMFEKRLATDKLRNVESPDVLSQTPGSVSAALCADAGPFRTIISKWPN
jgi:hypothetical protein